MTTKLLSASLAAVFALTALSQTSMADPRRGGGDWINNGTALTGLETSGASSLIVTEITLPDAK